MVSTKRKSYLILTLCTIVAFALPRQAAADGCTCPTSSLTVSPQVVQPGEPITLTFPWDRANYIENQTTGGLAQEPGHVDNLTGGSIHFENGSNNFNTFHAGSICGTYTWNHQSKPGPQCGQCEVSTQFTVCGTSTPPTSTPQPTDIPQSTATPFPIETIPVYVEPTAVPQQVGETTVPVPEVTTYTAPPIRQQEYVQPTSIIQPYRSPTFAMTPNLVTPQIPVFSRPAFISTVIDSTKALIISTFQPFTKRSDIQPWEVTKSFVSNIYLSFINEAGL